MGQLHSLGRLRELPLIVVREALSALPYADVDPYNFIHCLSYIHSANHYLYPDYVMNRYFLPYY